MSFIAAFSRHRKSIFLITGVLIALILAWTNPFGVSPTAAKVLAVAALMITWWVTEALPMPVVALLPLVLFPLSGVASIKETAAPYANPVIFLFMGGFMLGLAIEKWNLHRRIALNILRLTGSSGNRIILGFMIVTGLLSMWLSNTATAMMMFPIALSVIQVMEENNPAGKGIKNFSLVILLMIAYASNLGGIATIIGTPPSVAYAAHLYEKYGRELGFMEWMLVCTPLSILLLFSLYWVLVKWLYPNRISSNNVTSELIREEIRQLGTMQMAEKRVLGVLAVTVLLWMTRSVINDIQTAFRLDDTIIALMCILMLFICPAGNPGNKEGTKSSLLIWTDTNKMAWGILLLFGGGISMANALERAGLMHDIGQWIAQFSGNIFLLVVAVTVVSIFISEVMSNVAQVIVLAPVLSALADVLQIDPLIVGMPMTLAASCAGMSPMGTPPNAIVFASGRIRFVQMVKAGFVLNIISIILIVLFCWFIMPAIMGR